MVEPATTFVMAGLVPAIHDLLGIRKTWMPGTRPGMTTDRWPPPVNPSRRHVFLRVWGTRLVLAAVEQL